MTETTRSRIPRLLRPVATAGDHRVTTFELFFDLVFVFAFTQVSHFMAVAHSGVGVLEGLIILGLLWMSWISYGWLGNQTLADQGLVRIGMSAALVAVFVLALVIPESFEDLEGGLSGPLVFAVAYIVVRVVHLSLYLAASREDPGLRRQVLITWASMAAGGVLLIVGAVVGGEAQLWLWLAGFVLDVGITFVTSRRGEWRIQSTEHWAERFGLIVILALGESIVAVGVGVAQEPVSVAILVGATLSIALSTLLWWLYFDIFSTAAEERFTELDARGRAALAVEGYTYLHFLLVAGIIVTALGIEEAMHEIGSTEPLGWFGAWALLGGVALYLAAQGCFWRRSGGTWKPWRMGVGALLLALLPVAAAVPPMAALALVVVVIGALATLEIPSHRRYRAQMQAHEA